MKKLIWGLAVACVFTALAVFSQEKVYTIQVGAQTELKSAEQIIAGLKKRGLSAFYTISEIPAKGTFYQINVGHLPTRAKAQAFRAKLIEKYQLPGDAFVKVLGESNSEAPTHVNATPLPMPTPPPSVVSEDLPPLKPAPSPTAVPSPGPTSATQVEPSTPVIAAAPSPAPSPGPAVTGDGAAMVPTPPPSAAPSATPLPTANTAAAQSESRSFFSVIVGPVADVTNYSVNFPPNYGGLGLTNTLTSSPQVGTGFALLPTLSLSRLIEIQTGVMLFQRTFNVTYNNGVAPEPGADSYNAIEVPLLIYFKLLNHLALGVGGYYLTNPTGVMTQATYGGAPMPDANLTGNDWGFTGDLNYSFELGAFCDLVLSARYNYGSGGFTSASSTPLQVFTDTQLLLGLRFFGFK